MWTELQKVTTNKLLRYGRFWSFGEKPCQVFVILCAPSNHCKYYFIPFTSRQWAIGNGQWSMGNGQWASTWMLRTGHMTLSPVPSKTEHRIMLPWSHLSATLMWSCTDVLMFRCTDELIFSCYGVKKTYYWMNRINWVCHFITVLALVFVKWNILGMWGSGPEISWSWRTLLNRGGANTLRRWEKCGDMF